MARVKVTYPAFDRTEVVRRLRKAYISLARKLPISRMILFGSYAQDRYTAGSDIDLIVVYKGRQRDDTYKLVVDEVKLPRLEARVYTEEEFDAIIAGSPRLAEVLAKDGIVITGMGDR